MSTPSPEVLWTPDRREAGNSAVAAFARYVRERHGLPIADTDYAALHAWSVDDIDSFWSAAAEFLGVRFHDEPRAVLGRDDMPGTEWFPGATLNPARRRLHRLTAVRGRLPVDRRRDRRARPHLLGVRGHGHVHGVPGRCSDRARVAG
jgi:acetoacetyl-CoA synthetase